MRLRVQSEKRWPEMVSRLAIGSPARATSGSGVYGPVGLCSCFNRLGLEATAIVWRARSTAKEMIVGPHRPKRHPRHLRTWVGVNRSTEITSSRFAIPKIKQFHRRFEILIGCCPLAPNALQLHHRAGQMFGPHSHQHLIGKHPVPMPASRFGGRLVPTVENRLM